MMTASTAISCHSRRRASAGGRSVPVARRGMIHSRCIRPIAPSSTVAANLASTITPYGLVSCSHWSIRIPALTTPEIATVASPSPASSEYRDTAV